MTSKHGEKGLTDKYIVLKKRGSNKQKLWLTDPNNPRSKMLSGYRKRSWSFVLSPEKDDAYGDASRTAMLAYANAIQPTNPQLADDLRMRVTEIVYKMREERNHDR